MVFYKYSNSGFTVTESFGIEKTQQNLLWVSVVCLLVWGQLGTPGGLINI